MLKIAAKINSGYHMPKEIGSGSDRGCVSRSWQVYFLIFHSRKTAFMVKLLYERAVFEGHRARRLHVPFYIRRGNIAYGKFFDNRAGFISKEWIPVFANYRRDGYDFDARWDDELASHRQKKIMDLFLNESEGEDSGQTSDRELIFLHFLSEDALAVLNCKYEERGE